MREWCETIYGEKAVRNGEGKICLTIEIKGKKLEIEFFSEKNMRRMLVWLGQQIRRKSISDLILEIVRYLEDNSEDQTVEEN